VQQPATNYSTSLQYHIFHRQAETYEREVESYKEDSEAYITQVLFESTTDTEYPTQAKDEEKAAFEARVKKYDNQLRVFRRDIATGHESAFHGVEPSIVTSLQNILNKYSN
jgi:hypothetical protein